MKPWHEWDFITLSEEAERGRVGQGAVVDAMRRVVKSVDQFSKVSTWLAGAMIFLGIVQILIALFKKP